MSNNSTIITKKKRYKHGHKGRLIFSSEYISWSCMIQRCYNKKNISYSNYGERNIIVCELWKNSFINFPIPI